MKEDDEQYRAFLIGRCNRPNMIFLYIKLVFLFIFFIISPVYAQEDIVELTKDILGDVFVHQEQKHDMVFYLCMKDSNIVGLAFFSQDVTPYLFGYNGHINLFVVIDLKGEIKGLKIISHKETPDVITLLSKERYIQKFTGKNVQKIKLGKQIDTITGATISSKAIFNIVKEASRKVLDIYYGKIFNDFKPDYKKDTTEDIEKLIKSGISRARYYK